MCPETARKVAANIHGECKRYAGNPLMGELREDILPGIRLFTVRPHVIFYFPLDDGIRVARVIHGALITRHFSRNCGGQPKSSRTTSPPSTSLMGRPMRLMFS